MHSVSRLFSRVSSLRHSSIVTKQQVRHLNIHEYQSKEICDKFGVHVQRWRLATNKEEAAAAATALAAPEFVVKAQIHAGGRGKGHFPETGFKGGVHVTSDSKAVPNLTEQMLGRRLVTKQTPAEGVQVRSVMICESVDITSEKYIAIVMDRACGGPAIMASAKGGMDIEKVAEENPDDILVVPIDISKGVSREQANKLALKCGLAGEDLVEAEQMILRLYDLFISCDATQVEVNPMATTKKHGVVCVDAKLNFDDNAAFRQGDIFAMRDPAEEDPREVEASKHNLNYIGLDGNIGCMVNGAGLAMATMDTIHLHGGAPANFLDVGGNASEKTVTEAFRLLTADSTVKAILVNIFGGIVKCDLIAQGIVNAAKTVSLKVPLIVRLEGTNVTQGKAILKASGMKVTLADDLDAAARSAVAALK